MAGVKRLIGWWRLLPLPWHAWRIVRYVPSADEVPERLAHRSVVLVGNPGRATWAALDCPCKTGHRLLVNLDGTRRPVWRIESRRPLSIHPSIDDVTPERRCHFTIRNGKAKWVRHGGEV